eukprot:SAG31_NODE_11732_length_1002_cov_1.413068_2_plen_77_part_01
MERLVLPPVLNEHAPHGSLSRTQSWDTNSPMIPNSSGLPVMQFGTPQVRCFSRRGAVRQTSGTPCPGSGTAGAPWRR